MFRRVLAISLVLAASMPMTASAAPTANDWVGRFDRPQDGYAPESTMLRAGTPEEVNLDRGALDAAARRIEAWTHPDPGTGHPLYAGAVTLQAHNGVVVDRRTSGYAVRYADGEGTELPPRQRVPMREDTIFDVASISKLFTSIAVLQLAEAGKLDVHQPVADHLPEFGVNGKKSITIKQLLTHTSGLEPDLPLWRDYPDKPSRIKAVMDVAPQSQPGTEYIYSDLNLITLGVLVERLTGTTLDNAVRQGITEPLGMTDTGYNPPKSKLDRIAATEYSEDPPRGMVRGSVHDENAWSLGGVAGHAGVFSTARDLATLGQAVLNGGGYAGTRILRESTVEQMLTNYNTAFPDDSHGLGFELNQRWYMGGLSAPRSAGHTGFTGTSLVLDPASRSVNILLTNRVHPSRDWGSINPARETLATGLAKAMAVRPARGRDAWHTAIGDAASATLRTQTLRPSGAATAGFDAFVDSEDTDKLTLEASADGKNWRAVPLRAEGEGAPRGEVKSLSGAGHRAWWRVTASLGDRPVALRWRFTTDESYTGRGIYLDDLQVRDSSGVLLDGERRPEAFTPDGWHLAHR
ncbi:MAG: serine hydrolase [Pseudonocardiaceae bacterium]|nr:serine hydrolase [Pseudonocardiaceae bacterium]